MDPFVLSATDELWATIYQRRKNCIPNPSRWFDKAADINQPANSLIFKTIHSQDDEVKDIFRQFVDYVAKVSNKQLLTFW